MADRFTLTVHYKNQRRTFEGELRITGYTHRIAMNVDGIEIIFEPDEERNYRAVIYDSDSDRNHPNAQLLEAIAVELEAALK